MSSVLGLSVVRQSAATVFNVKHGSRVVEDTMATKEKPHRDKQCGGRLLVSELPESHTFWPAVTRSVDAIVVEREQNVDSNDVPIHHQGHVPLHI